MPFSFPQVCNSNNNCHCDVGWEPPDCKYSGSGGSVESGPAQEPRGLFFALCCLPSGCVQHCTQYGCEASLIKLSLSLSAGSVQSSSSGPAGHLPLHLACVVALSCPPPWLVSPPACLPGQQLLAQGPRTPAEPVGRFNRGPGLVSHKIHTQDIQQSDELSMWASAWINLVTMSQPQNVYINLHVINTKNFNRHYGCDIKSIYTWNCRYILKFMCLSFFLWTEVGF